MENLPGQAVALHEQMAMNFVEDENVAVENPSTFVSLRELRENFASDFIPAPRIGHDVEEMTRCESAIGLFVFANRDALPLFEFVVLQDAFPESVPGAPAGHIFIGQFQSEQVVDLHFPPRDTRKNIRLVVDRPPLLPVFDHERRKHEMLRLLLEFLSRENI